MRQKGTDSLEKAVWLGVDVLLRDKHQPRQHFPDEDIEELGLSLLHEGQKQAVIVSPAKEKKGFYYIKYGESRWLACKKKGITRVLCIIDHADEYDGSLNVARVLGQTVENVRRVGHRHSELVRVLALILQEEQEQKPRGAVERAERRFAEALGKSIPWAQNYRTLTNLHPDLLQMIDVKGSGLTFVIGVELARNDLDVQKMIFEEAQKKNTTGQMQMLHKIIGSLSRHRRIESGKRVRTRGSDARATYFSFFGKIAKMKDHLVGHLGDAEFEKFEADCLAFGIGDGARHVLPQAKEVLRFLQQRVAVLEQSLRK